MCLSGAGIAATGVKLRSVQYGMWEDLYISNVTANGWDLNPSTAANTNVAFNTFSRIYTDLSAAAAVNANGWLIGAGTTDGNDTTQNYWLMNTVNYQNGKGFICGAADYNFMYQSGIEPVGGGTGTSLQMLGHASSTLRACRDNFFQGGFGAGGVGAPVAETATNPSVNNNLWLDVGSGGPIPTINGSATLKYEVNDGRHFDNRSAATTFVQGGMAYKASGTNGAVFDIDTANSTNFATAAKFGPTLPLYFHYSQPIIGLNSYWDAGLWRYGKGSSSNYGGKLAYNATNGALTFSSATATGNAAAALSGETNLWIIDRFGHERVSANTAPGLASCGTSPAISGDDRAGEVTMGTGTPTGCVISFANAYAAVPYCTVSWQATPLASQNYAVSATAITLTQTATSSNKINYVCNARSGG